MPQPTDNEYQILPIGLGRGEPP